HRTHWSCRRGFVVVGPSRAGFAYSAGLDVRPFLCERSVLATVCRSRKRTVHRFAARQQKSRTQRTGPSMVPTPVVARSIHCVPLVCVCTDSHACFRMDDTAPLYQSIVPLHQSTGDHDGSPEASATTD